MKKIDYLIVHHFNLIHKEYAYLKWDYIILIAYFMGKVVVRTSMSYRTERHDIKILHHHMVDNLS